MNEEIANSTTQQPAVATTAPAPGTVATPVESAQAPAAQPVTAQPAPVAAPAETVQTVAPAQPATEVTPTTAAPAPAAQPQAVVQPASEPVQQPQQAVVQQPVASQPVPQPTTEVATAPATTPATTPVVPEVAPQQAAPVAPQGETIKPAPALDPIANNPQPVTTQPTVPQATTQPTLAPSNPLQTDINTNVGFVAVGENINKKKHGFLKFAIVMIVLAGLGALGYFVIYPFAIKQLTKPDKVYNAVIDNAFKELNTTVTTFTHNKATFNAELKVDSNLEELKDLTGFVYSANFGIDTEEKNIQLGVDIKDSDSQEHSANAYVKGDREYLRLSSYRELIYLGTSDEYKETWNKLYDVFDDLTVENSEYLVNTFRDLLKNSIVQNKLSKEEASITINGKTYKVLNNKYTIDNETLITMYSSILEGFKENEKALEIIAGIYGIKKEDLIEELNKVEVPEKILEDDQVYYLNIYTYSIKTKVIGVELVNGDNAMHYYTMDGYFEFKLNAKQEDIDTGKENEINLTAIGKKEDGKDIVNVTYNEKDLAKFVISSWDEKNKEFTYEIYLDDQTITGEINLVVDRNDERIKIAFKGSGKIDKDYVDISLNISNDWTSEVANINASTAKTLSEAELEEKLNEFVNTLKNTPLAKLFTTVSGEFDESIFKHRTEDTTKALEDNSYNNNEDPNTNLEDEPVEEDHTYHFTEDDSNSI